MTRFKLGFAKPLFAVLITLCSAGAWAADYPAKVTNKVTVALPSGVTDPNTGNNASADGTPAAGEECTAAESDDENACATDTNDLNVNIAQPTKAFAPATLAVGEASQLTITLTNNNFFVATLQADFVDNLPAPVVVATPANATTTCGNATLTATSGANSITLAAGATIPSGQPPIPGGSCTITVDVTSPTAGTYTNQLPAGALDTGMGQSDPASADITFDNAIVANDEANNPAPINGYEGGVFHQDINDPAQSVLENDTLNGAILDPADVTLTPGTAPVPANGTITMNPDGTITASAQTTAGQYSYPYTICEVANPTNCDSAIATVFVAEAFINALPIGDTGTVHEAKFTISGATGGDSTAPVTLNDTLNNATANLILGGAIGEVTLTPGTAPTPASGSITMNPATGVVTVAPGTTPGVYTYPYKICENLNTPNPYLDDGENCDDETSGGIATITVTGATVTITATVDASEPSTNGSFTITSTDVVNTDTVVSYTVNAASTATAGSDYTALTGTATILAGQNSVLVDVNVIDDSIVESSETVVIDLTSTDNPAVSISGTATDQGTVNISDDDVSLTIVKNVINDDGGSAVVADFNITTNAGALTFGAGVVAGDTTTYTSNTLNVSAGSYSLVEDDVTNYAEGSWSCDIGTVTNSAFNAGSVDLVAGDVATCSITNDDQSADLAVTKDVDNATPDE
ncbi:Calx-beta domain-containing protein, partial [Kangiella sp. TOML190]|uniref:beta strand repeat-containing protein n=1 Tax=Kangiella sp. TOML190 TaxID=2931351 RepID=UPI00203D5163